MLSLLVMSSDSGSSTNVCCAVRISCAATGFADFIASHTSVDCFIHFVLKSIGMHSMTWTAAHIELLMIFATLHLHYLHLVVVAAVATAVINR